MLFSEGFVAVFVLYTSFLKQNFSFFFSFSCRSPASWVELRSSAASSFSYPFSAITGECGDPSVMLTRDFNRHASVSFWPLIFSGRVNKHLLNQSSLWGKMGEQ